MRVTVIYKLFEPKSPLLMIHVFFLMMNSAETVIRAACYAEKIVAPPADPALVSHLIS